MRIAGIEGSQTRAAIRGLTRAARQVFMLMIAGLAAALPLQAGDWNYVVPAANDAAVTVSFDAGPLGGSLHAARKVKVVR